MKKIIAGLALSVAFLPVGAQANELVFGVKAGVYIPEPSGIDPAPVISAQISYEFLDLVAADIAIELEAGTTVQDGDVDLQVSGVKAEYSVQNIGLYISARTAGPIYAIGRIGVARSDIEITASGTANVTAKGDDTGLSYGAGVGFSTGLRTEIELTAFNNDSENNLYASLGFAF